MARTKVMEVVVQPGKRRTRNQSVGQNQTTVPAPPGGANPGRPDTDGEDEETKENDPVSEDPSNDEHDERGGDDAPSETTEAPASTNDDSAAMAPVAVLAVALQQMATTMARIDARLDHLSTTSANPTATAAPTDTSTQVVTTQQPPAPVTNPPAAASAPQAPAAPRASPADTRRRVVLQSRDDDNDSSDDDDSLSSGSDDDSDGDGNDGGGRRGRRQPVTRPGDGDFHRNRRRTIRDLDLPTFLPTFLPTPQTSVTTGIARVDLVLEGARLSGRCDWTDQELYYILGNKLQDSAARWWVQLDRKLRDNERTWTRLKSSLLRRYGERPDKTMAEWRVGQRRMMPGETYADFAAALRDLCGNNRIRKRVLLAQFYRSLDRTTRLLVKQRPKPSTLEEAVDKATEINDPIDNVAQGMENIGQAFVTAPDTYVVPANGTTGHMALIPGVGSTDVAEEEKLTCFTNSRGVYNKYLGLWEAPKDRVWNGHMWAPVPRKRSATTAAPMVAKRVSTAKIDKKAKVHMAVAVDDYEDESDGDQEAEAAPAPPPPKKPKFTVRLSKAATRQVKAVNVPRTTTEAAPASRRLGEVKCYACNQMGHFARECPDDEARARNDEYLAKRRHEVEAQGNEDRAT